MTEPTDTEILEFLLNQFQAHNLKMNGESDWVFMNGGSRMNYLKGKTVRDAVITAMKKAKDSKEFYEWLEE
jgi:hypothetical protein